MQPAATAPQPTAPVAPAPDLSQFGHYSDWAKDQLSKGYTADDLHQKLAESNIDPTQAPQHKGNWFTHLLPTIGSIAIPALGALLAPETGGTSLLVAAGLSGLGAAGGKAAENATEGKGITDNLATAGAEGAIGGLAGGIGGKVLGKAASFLGGAGEKVAAEKAAQTAAEDGINEAMAIKNNYGSISPRLQQDLKLGSNQATLRNLGYDITDPYSLRTASLAGHDPAGGLSLNSIYDEALQGAKPVDMSDFGKLTGAPSAASAAPSLTAADLKELAKQGISPEVAAKGTVTGGGDALTPTVGYSHIDPVSPVGKALQDFGLKTDQVLPDSMSATDVRRLQQAVGKQIGNTQRLINNSELQGIANTDAEGQLNALHDLYAQLGNRIKTPEVDSLIAGRVTTPAERQQLIAKFGNLHGNQIADTIDSAGSADDLLGHMQSYTQMGKLSDMAINDLENATATPRAVARVKGESADGGTPTAGSNTVSDLLHMATTPHTSILSTAVKGAARVAQNPAILSTLSRIGALGSKLAPAAGAAVATSPNLAADPVAGGAMPGGSPGATMGGTMNGNANSTMGADPMHPDTSLDSILQRYLYMGNVDPYLLSSTSPVVQALAPAVQKNRMVGTSLEGLPASFANAGGAQGVGGILSHISGLIPGTAAHQYQQQQQAAAQELAGVMGISPQAAMGFLPQVMQNQGTANLSGGILDSLRGSLAY